MFNLCKTVKIYHTVNHYHPQQTSTEPSELQFQEENAPVAPPPSAHTSIRMVESHSVSPRKSSRTGINISLKESSASPYKNSQHTLTHDLSRSQHNRSSTNSHAHSSERSSIKLKNFNRFEKCAPVIVESKITYEQTSPRLPPKQNPEVVPSSVDNQVQSLADLPLKRRITGTTQLSNNSNQPKIVVSSPNPLKKSSTFLRSSSKSRIDQSVKSSLENSLNNSIDFKFSNYKLKREDASDSLLRLSCSSYSEIFQRPANQVAYSDFSQSCSLELKREQSCFLKEYVCDVNQSIIITKPAEDKGLKVVRSNNDLLDQDDMEQFKQNQSNILERSIESPVKKLKKRYGSNLLHPYDKETIESKSFYSKSHGDSSFKQIIDQSIVIEHEIENKFIPVKGKEINKAEYQMFLAVQSIAKLLVTIKQLPSNNINKINQELSIYRELDSRNLGDVNISRLFQMFTHGSIFILVKEPYQLTLQEFIDQHSTDFAPISWQFVTRSIEESILQTVTTLKKHNIHLSRPISTEDIVHVLGEWKLHSPDMFVLGEEGGRTSVELSQVLALLRSQVQGRLGRHNHG